LAYKFDGAEFSLKRKSAGKSAFQLKTNNNKNFRFIRTLGRAWDLPGPIKSYAFPDQVKTYFQNSDFLSQFELAYEQQMDAIIHLGPFRDYPRREYTWSGARPVDVGRRGERVVDAILAATERAETRNMGPKKRRLSFQSFVAAWLQNMGLITDFSVDEIAKGSSLYRVSLQVDKKSPKVLLTDVGFGVSQVLPALVLLYYAPKKSTVMLEQPEIHLHPAVQAALADVILNAIETRDIQVILESHSEHLLRRIQRRIAEEKFSNDDAKLYFCELANGQSRIERLDIDLFGRILNWPADFFGDEFGEIAAREEAALARQIQSAK
jgi:predicted ATPase